MKEYFGNILTNIISNTAIPGGEDIKDIKDIINYDFKYIYLLVLLAIIIFLLIFLNLKKKKSNIMEEEMPVLPPEADALDKINKLREAKLIEQGRYKEFYTIISDIIRAFLEGQYQIPAMDQTTYEIVCEIKNINIILCKAAIIQDFLSNCDMVKFAKQIPQKEDPEKMLDIAVEIIITAKNGRTLLQSELKENV